MIEVSIAVRMNQTDMMVRWIERDSLIRFPNLLDLQKSMN